MPALDVRDGRPEPASGVATGEHSVPAGHPEIRGHPASAGRPARVVRERIDPRLTGALFANYRTPVDAVLELVDNAVDSRIPGRPLELDLALRAGAITP